MLLFDPLYDAIVHGLIQKKGSTIQDLHQYIEKKHQISLPNFYKVIGKLINNQIVIKENGKLLFHSRWVLGFLDLVDNLKQAYIQEIEDVSNLKEGETMYYEATSIEAIDGVRGDWMFAVNRIYQNQATSYVYQAHPYYALGMNQTEMAFFKEARKIADVYFLTGNTGFLDQYGVDCYTQIGVPALATDKVAFLREGYCVTVVGDYVFELLYPKEVSEYFQIFFDSIQKIEDFNPKLFYRIFQMKSNCRLSLRRDRIQARNVKLEFEKHFSNFEDENKKEEKTINAI